MKKFKDYLQETEKRKTGTKTRPATDWSFELPNDDNLPAAPAPEPEREQPRNEPQDDNRRRASQRDTLRATGNIEPNQRMRDLLGRMRDIEAEPDDVGYPDQEPENLPDVRVTTQNLPAVAGQALQAAGAINPDFHKVANLPGNMSRAIRTLGKSLFRSFTSTDTDNIWMIGNLGGQGPNTSRDVNGVAAWIRDNGERVTTGDIDFDTTIPGYSADIQQWRAAGIRWLLVRDEFGDYIYSWPEQESRDAQGDADRPQIGQNRPRLANR